MMVEFVGGPRDGESIEFGSMPPLTVVVEMPRADDERCVQFRQPTAELPENTEGLPIGRYGAGLIGNEIVYSWQGEY
jgi:hypothetical protein